jgi:hypothetical protein
VSRRPARFTDPDVLAAVACLGGFWWFLYRATAEKGREQPVWIRWATWW